ncbi:MAG: SpoIIE family protein phosphatase [Isosphaeraceae bacterium]
MRSRQPVVPTLELIAPSQPSRLIELSSQVLTIGRNPNSKLWLNRPQVSWEHARVVRNDGEHYAIEDLESYNSTYLDGQRLTPRVPARLKDGSRIRICDITLVFHRQAVALEEQPSGTPTILESIDDISTVSLNTFGERAGIILRAVLEINRLLGGTTDLNSVLGRALEGLFSVFPQVECGFIVTSDPDGKLNPRATRHRDPAGPAPVLSRTVLEHVMREGRALLITDAADDSRFNSTESVDRSGIRTALCAPVLNHRGQPVGMIQLDSRAQRASFLPTDLELLAAVAVPVGVVIENHRLLRERAALTAAGEVQSALLPRSRPRIPGYSFWERYQPALEVGGDYYDYIPVEISPPAGTSLLDSSGTARNWAVALGDVAGKGMPAALLMASLCSEVRHLVRSGAGPAEVVERVNQTIYDADLPGRFVTFVLTMIDSVEHRLALVNAGHLPPLIRRVDGTVETVAHEEAGFPLGVDRDGPFQVVEAQLAPGDVVVLYTDGVTEAADADDRLFGIDNLTRAIAAAHPKPAQVGESILRAIRSHVGARPQSDDIAIVCFARD